MAVLSAANRLSVPFLLYSKPCRRALAKKRRFASESQHRQHSFAQAVLKGGKRVLLQALRDDDVELVGIERQKSVV